MEYQKINTLFKRDERGIIIPEEFTLPEFGWHIIVTGKQIGRAHV